MPTYKNNSAQRVTYNSTVWQPQEIKAVQFTVPPAITTLALVSEDPPIKLFVVSEIDTISKDEEKVFDMPVQPLEEMTYTLNISCPSKGQIEVYINTHDNRITLLPGWGLRGPYPSYILNKIIVKGVANESDFTVLVEQSRAVPNVVVG